MRMMYAPHNTVGGVVLGFAEHADTRFARSRRPRRPAIRDAVRTNAYSFRHAFACHLPQRGRHGLCKQRAPCMHSPCRGHCPRLAVHAYTRFARGSNAPTARIRDLARIKHGGGFMPYYCSASAAKGQISAICAGKSLMLKQNSFSFRRYCSSSCGPQEPEPMPLWR